LAEARFTFEGIQPKEDQNNDLNLKAGNRFLPWPLVRRIMLQQNGVTRGSMDQLIAIFSMKYLTAQMEPLDVHDHYDRWRKNLLQGLGIRPADRFQPRLAAVGG
jgi:hypothetical protein